MAKFEGNRGYVAPTSGGSPIVVPVVITDSKRAFGRVDVLVHGKRGVFMAPTWVDSAKLVDTTDQAAVEAITGVSTGEKVDA